MHCRALEVNPGSRPYLWQRGLSLYYAEDYEKAAQQFRDDVAVNPNDTEEAIWAYLSECRTLGVDAARQQLLNVCSKRFNGILYSGVSLYHPNTK